MKQKSAQSLVETVIAAALVSLGILAALSLASNSTKQNSYAKNVAEASKYTSQASDWLRSQRSALGWSSLADKSQTDSTNNFATYCLNTLPDSTDFTDLISGPCDSNSFIPDTSADENTPFTRQIVVDTNNVSEGILHFTIQVSWEDQTTQSTNLELELTSWQ